MSRERGFLRGWRRPLLIVLATAPIGVAVLSFVFMARSEMAFDETSCPYQEGEVRAVSETATVREDVRRCQPGVEERRWVLLRRGQPPLELGRRRLEERLYQGYSWSTWEEGGRVTVEVRNPGLDPRIFREPDPDGGLDPRASVRALMYQSSSSSCASGCARS